MDWDVRTVTYAPERHPFAAWVLDRLRADGYSPTSLDRFHEAVPIDDVAGVTKRLVRATEESSFRDIYFSFVREVLEPLAGREIAPQRYPNFRAHVPSRPEMCIPFHTDSWYGHGPDERNVWVPLTRAEGTASLQIVPLDVSERLTREAIARRMRLAEMESLFGPHAAAVSADVGDVVLFTPHHLHGNTANLTPRTRVSIDFRVALKGGRVNKKRVGGYFVLMPRAAS